MNTEPRWSVPSPYDYPAAIDSMGSISAPLLAGFSVALAAVALSSPQSFHWIHVALFLLVGAAFALVTTVQFAFRARQFVVGPDDLESWWPDHHDPDRREMLRREQRYHRQEFESWASRARWAYNVGILLFALAVTALLAPRHLGHASAGQLAPALLAAIGFLAEVVWICRTARATQIKAWPDPPGPEA